MNDALSCRAELLQIHLGVRSPAVTPQSWPLLVTSWGEAMPEGGQRRRTWF